jgi:hypothetical protein
VVYWQKFDPAIFEYELDEDELAGHSVTTDEAVEVIWGEFKVYRNKSLHGGYQVIGRTDAGRLLKLIVYEKSRGLIRIVTGWDV